MKQVADIAGLPFYELEPGDTLFVQGSHRYFPEVARECPGGLAVLPKEVLKVIRDKLEGYLFKCGQMKKKRIRNSSRRKKQVYKIQTHDPREEKQSRALTDGGIDVDGD